MLNIASASWGLFFGFYIFVKNVPRIFDGTCIALIEWIYSQYWFVQSRIIESPMSSSISFIMILVRGSIVVIKYHDQRKLEEQMISMLLRETKTRTRVRNWKQRFQENTDWSLPPSRLLSYLSYTTKDHLPGDTVTYNILDLLLTDQKNVPTDLPPNQSNGVSF